MRVEEFAAQLIREKGFEEFSLPIKIENDKDYYEELSDVLQRYEKIIRNSKILDSTVKNKTSENIENIKDALVCYYAGNLVEAKNKISNVIQGYLNTSLFSNISKSPAFYGFLDDEHNGEDPTFYRARIGRSQFTYSDLLTIPMTQRGNISTQRFSIPGTPCFYLGTTSYCCWLEMDTPKYEEFNVTAVKLKNDKKILNLAFDIRTLDTISIHGQIEDFKTKSLRKDFIDIAEQMIELWPLVCATSFVNLNHTKFFRSEYIISQLLMQIVNEIPDVYGIAYLSKRLENTLGYSAFPIAINLAIPSLQNVTSHRDYDHSKKYGNQLDGIIMSKPSKFLDYINFSRQLYETAKHTEELWKETLVNGFNVRFRVLDEEPIFYNNTYFGKFDEYLNCRIKNIIDIDKI